MDIKYFFLNKLNIIDYNYNIGNNIYSNENAFLSIINNSISGIIIRNLFTKDELDKMILTINNIDEKDFDIPHPGAKTFPFACSSSKYDNNFGEFFSDSNYFINSYRKLFGFDFINKINQCFIKLNGNKNVLMAKDSKSDSHYLPGTFRIIHNEKVSVGLTQPHIGIEYVERCLNNSYKPIKDYIDIKKQLSFFVLLQKPEKGGDFTVFNFDYNIYDKIEGDNIIVKKQNNKRINIYSKKKYFETIILKPGDAFIFPDYKLWHRVEPLYGEVPRISFGCWLGYGINDNLYFWS